MNALLQRCKFSLPGALLAAALLTGVPAAADSLSAYGNAPDDAQARREAKERRKYLDEAREHSLRYLEEARQFRTEGRYELARQRYLQALSICTDNQTLFILKRELDGVELLLRTMR
ncbi:MAG: hypothetical protein E7022_10915 [Desulfovibrio desulfuricans]|jgi:hypothetical protein|nr:hypothetical protein [Desulfovibrio desulfuricans]